MDTLQTLVEYFSKFPGIGPRQAKRFGYYLLTRDAGYIRKLSDLMLEMKKNVSICDQCFRFFSKGKNKTYICEICSDKTRDKSLLMVVGHDVDFESVEKSSSYRGYYFILGGLLPILEKNPEQKIRVNELVNVVKKRSQTGLKEMIIALSLNPEGENTMEYVTSKLEPLKKELGLKISTLGRGLSTGTELEYSDTETIKNALKNRF